MARSTRTAQPKVRFVKQYANWAGNVFRRYEAPDGRLAEVRVREGYQGRYEYTNAEARAEAAARLSGQPFARWSGRAGSPAAARRSPPRRVFPSRRGVLGMGTR